MPEPSLITLSVMSWFILSKAGSFAGSSLEASPGLRGSLPEASFLEGSSFLPATSFLGSSFLEGSLDFSTFSLLLPSYGLLG